MNSQIEKIRNQRYVLYYLNTQQARVIIGTFRYYDDAYLIMRSCQDSDPEGNYWIQDDGDMPFGC